jgi:hypothetical protein
MMSQTIDIVLFWIVVIAAIRIVVWFPDSLPARVLFARQGPVRGRAESDADFLLRCARFHGGWFAQAALLFAAGAAAQAWNPALAESLPFIVLWAAVIPALGAFAFAAAAIDVGRSFAARRREHARADVREAEA